MPGKRRVGILGGTFDPVHIGHLIIAEEARSRLELEEVVFVPARDPWRKARHGLAPVEERLAMVRLAVAGNPSFRVSLVDLERQGPSYSVDTILDLRGQFGEDADFYFILGHDALMDLPHWRQPARLTELAHVVSVGRPGYEIGWQQLERALPNAGERILVLDIPEVGISSTEIRQRVASGHTIRYWVPEAVAQYIREHKLYQDASAGGIAAPEGRR